MRLLIVDDHESMREALSRYFGGTKGAAEIGELANARHALAYCRAHRPEVVLMDICTEDNASGLEAAREITAVFPEIRVIMMTGFDEISYIPRAKEAGARGFVYKSESLEAFGAVYDRVLAGEVCFPQPKAIPMPQGESPLTAREMEILRLICKRMSNKEIAEALFISERTVKFHRENMLAKTGFDKIVDLAFYMITNGWINPLI